MVFFVVNVLDTKNFTLIYHVFFVNSMEDSYTFVAHTADESFIVKAKTMPLAFSLALRAFYEIMLGKEQITPRITKSFTIQAPRLRTLLYDFLNELIFLADAQHLVLTRVDALAITPSREGFVLTCTLTGDTLESYAVHTAIKSMTYSQMLVEEDATGVTLQVVVDM